MRLPESWQFQRLYRRQQPDRRRQAADALRGAAGRVQLQRGDAPAPAPPANALCINVCYVKVSPAGTDNRAYEK